MSNPDWTDLDVEPLLLRNDVQGTFANPVEVAIIPKSICRAAPMIAVRIEARSENGWAERIELAAEVEIFLERFHALALWLRPDGRNPVSFELYRMTNNAGEFVFARKSANRGSMITASFRAQLHVGDVLDECHFTETTGSTQLSVREADSAGLRHFTERLHDFINYMQSIPTPY